MFKFNRVVLEVLFISLWLLNFIDGLKFNLDLSFLLVMIIIFVLFILMGSLFVIV